MAQGKKKSKHPKSDLRYWADRVYKPKCKNKEGDVVTNSHYHVRIQAHGERRGVSLHIANKLDAQKAAKTLDTLVGAHGWDEGLRMFRGEPIPKKSNLTVGEYLEEVAAASSLGSHTLSTYTTKIRTIAADITKPKLPVKEHKNGEVKRLSRYDYINGGSALWQKMVDSTPLSKLNDAAILKWRNEKLKACARNPIKRSSATRTVNSYIRAGHSLFSPDITSLVPHLELPDPIPFRSVKKLPENIKPYRSEIPSPESLFTMAVDELATATPESEFQATWTKNGGTGKAPEPGPAERIRAELSAHRKNEAFKVLILGLCAGFRRGEIDTLQWSQVDFENNCIWAETTDVHQLKADSHGEVPVDPHITALLREWKKESNTPFVLNGGEPRPDAKKTVYRAERFHKEIIAWLRTKGITSNRPIHSLRKEYGSIINAQAGIHAASRLLRHKNISLTSAVYTDSRNKVTAGIGLKSRRN